jgi:hypothetical protein
VLSRSATAARAAAGALLLVGIAGAGQVLLVSGSDPQGEEQQPKTLDPQAVSASSSAAVDNMGPSVERFMCCPCSLLPYL